MNKLLLSLGLCWLLPIHLVQADTVRQECIGRLTFDVPEDMQWATFHADYVARITDGGGHIFSQHVFGDRENASYDYDDAVIYVSDIVERSKLDGAARYAKGTRSLYQKSLIKELARKKEILLELKNMKSTEGIKDSIKGWEESIAKTEHDIPLAHAYEHDLGIPDAYFLGSEDTVYDVLLWRKNRIYYFSLKGNDKNKSQRIKDLIARFQPRDLYEVPKGPGFCFPYGFIHDDGKTKYSIKNSLRFTREPNVIFTILNASAGDPYMKATSGTYNTDYNPGYDRENWQKTSFIESLYFDRRLVGMDGWRLDPKPGSAEKERAWFGLAHIGGLTKPLIAIQAKTFKQGTDDLTGLTPPPEVLMPSLKALTKSMKLTLGE
ncbi:T6SS immunity protein Tli4 family protein [Pseudomonas sp. S9]|uniref:T6SS immunity protein Tli4 family protein n=1 Tax=Pseudomonas sp. S9 TaxID=686578 RepID=UPI001EE6512B|nr:T6SS immunity protein Tli4 family protein [Pseudomonas sp. S9]